MFISSTFCIFPEEYDEDFLPITSVDQFKAFPNDIEGDANEEFEYEPLRYVSTYI